MPKYPYHDPQPYTGTPLTMVQARTSDLLYSSGTSPRYETPIDRRYARQLAGETVLDEKAPMADNDEHAWANNELQALNELDDVQGSGIFDPAGTHPNIWPDAGVFGVSYSIPGYHAREKMYGDSEVVDATTGRQIFAVPSGAWSLDVPAQIAWLERDKFKIPGPILRANDEYPAELTSTVNVMQNPQPIHGFGADEPLPPAQPSVQDNGAKLLLAVIGVGIAGGALYALTRKKGKR